MLADWRKEEDTEEHKYVVQIVELEVTTIFATSRARLNHQEKDRTSRSY